MTNEDLSTEPVTDFSEAPEVPVDPAADAEVTADNTDESTDEKPARKGRPRDEKTVERDAQVLAVITEKPSTRDEIATKLGVEGNLVYLSLWRMKRDEKIVKLNGKTWALPGTVLAEPEPKADNEPVADENVAAEG